MSILFLSTATHKKFPLSPTIQFCKLKANPGSSPSPRSSSCGHRAWMECAMDSHKLCNRKQCAMRFPDCYIAKDCIDSEDEWASPGYIPTWENKHPSCAARLTYSDFEQIAVMETWMSICLKDRFLSKPKSPATNAKTGIAQSVLADWNGNRSVPPSCKRMCVCVCLLLTSIFQILSGKRGSVSDSSNMQLWQFDLVRFC